MKKITRFISISLALVMVLFSFPAEAAVIKPTSMTLNVSQKTIDVNSIYQLQVKAVKPKKASKTVAYKTSNAKIATVSSKGVIKGKKEGTAKITVQSKANKKLKKTVKITVKRLRPYELTLNVYSLEMNHGESYPLKARVKAASALVWSSDNKAVATVDKNGKITAKKDGTANITVKTTKKSYNGKALSKTCKVNVTTEHHFEKIKEDLEYIYYKCTNCGAEKKEFNDKEYTIDLGNGKTDTIVGHYNLEMPSELLALCNAQREIFRADPLVMVDAMCKLQTTADLRAVESAYEYSNRRPNGEYVLDSFRYISAENLTNSGIESTAKDLFKDFLNAPETKETMINDRYRTTAISVFQEKRSDGTYDYNCAQLFSTSSLESWEKFQ